MLCCRSNVLLPARLDLGCINDSEQSVKCIRACQLTLHCALVLLLEKVFSNTTYMGSHLVAALVAEPPPMMMHQQYLASSHLSMEPTLQLL
jgi:dethiobiotin synthetase